MRRILALLIAGCGVVALAPPAGGSSEQQLVAGTGQRLSLAGVPLTIHVNAQSGPAGEDARGTFWTTADTADLGTVVLRGRITCLTVEGNRAAARGIVEESTAPLNPVGSAFQIQVTDNGSPGMFNDTNINFFGFEPGETGCPIIPFAEPPIEDGNFVVKDASTG
jgi:hypothetical protein